MRSLFSLMLVIGFLGIMIYQYQVFSGNSSLGEIAISDVPYALQDDSSKYNIDSSFPVIVGSDSATISMNSAIKAVLMTEINEFISLSKRAIEYGYHSELPYTFSSSYKVSAYKNYISILYSIAVFVEQAHGGEYVKTMTFDSNSGKQVELFSLLKDMSNLQQISDMAKKKLTDYCACLYDVQEDYLPIEQKKWIENGLAPIPEHFAAWVIGKEGITFFLESGQVAPYGAGVIEVGLPWDEIASFVKA